MGTTATWAAPQDKAGKERVAHHVEPEAPDNDHPEHLVIHRHVHLGACSAGSATPCHRVQASHLPAGCAGIPTSHPASVQCTRPRPRHSWRNVRLLWTSIGGGGESYIIAHHAVDVDGAAVAHGRRVCARGWAAYGIERCPGPLPT